MNNKICTIHKSDSLTLHAKEEFSRLRKLSRRNSFFSYSCKISSSLFRNLTRVSKLSTWDFFNTDICQSLSSRCVFNDMSIYFKTETFRSWLDTINRYFLKAIRIYLFFMIIFTVRNYIKKGGPIKILQYGEIFYGRKYGQISRSNFHDCTIYHNW